MTGAAGTTTRDHELFGLRALEAQAWRRYAEAVHQGLPVPYRRALFDEALRALEELQQRDGVRPGG